MFRLFFTDLARQLIAMLTTLRPESTQSQATRIQKQAKAYQQAASGYLPNNAHSQMRWPTEP